MKTTKKIASIILALLLMVGMVSVNGTTNAYASEPDNFNTVEKSVSEVENEGVEEDVKDTENDTEELAEKTVKNEETETEVFVESSEKKDSTENVENKNEDSTETTVVTEAVTVAREISGDGWKLSEAGVFTLLADIDGDQYYDGREYKYPWKKYAEQIKEVVVAEGVTEIPNSAFQNYSNLQKITLSSTVRTLGTYAFAQNTNLKEVNLNTELKHFGQCAFTESGFEEIILPPNAEYEGDIFLYCKNLKSVTVPSGTTWVGNAQFYGCTSLETLILEEGVPNPMSGLAADCSNLKYVWLPKSVTQLPSGFINNTSNTCIVGYKGTAAETYVNSPAGNKLTFHAIDGKDHTFGEWQTVQNPTCTEKGLKKHTCTICHAERTQAVDATGHIWDNGKVTLEATEKAEGVKTYTCTVCNATKTETIAKLVSSKNNNSDKENAQENPVFAQTNATSPKTGDSTNMFAWVLLMIVSAGAITVFYFKKRTTR